MRISTKVKNEVKELLIRGKGKLHLLVYSSNFSSKEIFKQSQSLTVEDLFNIHPPEQLRGRGLYEGICLQCKDKKTSFQGYRSGYRRFCSQKCGTQYVHDNSTDTEKLDRMEKLRSTMTERYGASSTMQVPELKCKVLDHWTPKKRKEALSKTHATLNKRYGTKGNRTKQQEKAYAPLFEKRGKSRQKYIQDNPSKLAYYKVKTVKIKNRSFDVQGYEGEVLKYLVNQRKTPIKSITMYPLSIPYIEHGKNRIYIVDIKAKIQNKWYLIEVKGAYTAGLFKSGQTMFYNMRRKVRAAHEAGHRMKVIIFNEKTDTFCEIDNLHELTISQVRKLVLE